MMPTLAGFLYTSARTTVWCDGHDGLEPWVPVCLHVIAGTPPATASDAAILCAPCNRMLDGDVDGDTEHVVPCCIACCKDRGWIPEDA